MSPEIVSDNTPPPLSEGARISGVFFDPKKAFADIAARPAWIVPIILMIVIGVVATYLIGSHIGWERAMRPMLESSKRMQQMDPQQREIVLQQQIKFAPIFGYLATILGVPIMALVIAAVVLLMSKMGGASLKFKQMFAITSYAMLPRAIAGILLMIVIFLKNPDEFNLQNPLAFNLAAFLDPSGNKFLYSLGTSFDLFAIWVLVLIAVGLSVASRNISFGKGLVLVAIPWLIWIFASSAVAGAFS